MVIKAWVYSLFTLLTAQSQRPIYFSPISPETPPKYSQVLRIKTPTYFQEHSIKFAKVDKPLWGSKTKMELDSDSNRLHLVLRDSPSPPSLLEAVKLQVIQCTGRCTAISDRRLQNMTMIDKLK